MSMETIAEAVKYAAVVTDDIDCGDLSKLSKDEIIALMVVYLDDFAEMVWENELDEDEFFAELLSNSVDAFHGWMPQPDDYMYKSLSPIAYKKNGGNVYCLNSSSAAHVSYLEATFFSEDYDALAEFLADFGFIDAVIHCDVAVQQTC